MSRRLLDKLPKMMEDPEFAAAWEDARDEFSIAREIIRTRAARLDALAKALSQAGRPRG